MSSESVLFIMYCPLRFLRVICGGAAMMEIVSMASWLWLVLQGWVVVYISELHRGDRRR